MVMGENRYQERGNRSKTERFIAAEISIGEESTNQSRNTASSIEDVNKNSCSYTFHVEYCC